MYFPQNRSSKVVLNFFFLLNLHKPHLFLLYFLFVIELENWIDNKEYDRLGLDDKYKSILGLELPYIVIPVKPGRNIALIVEVAARNMRQKMYGYNAAEELNKRIMEEIKNKSN